MPQVVHSTFQGTELHEDKRIKTPVRAASTANVTLTAPGSIIDGVTLAANDRVLLKNQTAPAQNGIYVWTGSAATMVRATDLNTAALFFFGFLVYVREGTANGGLYWAYSQPSAVTLETTAITFSAVGSPTFSGEVTASDFKATGLTGATAGTRLVGATASGAPSSGTFSAGDVVPALNGAIWVCTVAGSPGTWANVGFSSPMTTVGDLIVGGTAGAETRLAAGAATTVLTSNGAATLPTWQAPAGGGGGGAVGIASGGMVPIQVIGPLAAAAATVTFTVPSTYRNLRIVAQARGDSAATLVNINMQVNGDTAANYDSESLQWSAATVSASDGLGLTNANVGQLPAANSVANQAGEVEILFPNYSSTTFRKQGFYRAALKNASLDVGGAHVGISGVATWRSTAAITSISLFLSAGNFIAGSVFTLWGEADSAPTLPASQSSLIQEVVLGASAATISLANIPQTYRDLRLVMQTRGDTAATNFEVRMQFNGDTGANYTRTLWDSPSTGLADTQAFFGIATLAGATASANQAGSVMTTIPNYTATTFFKDVFSSAREVSLIRESANGGTWSSLAAINSILLFPSAGNFVAGTTVRLYGEPATSLPKIAEVVLAANQTTISFTAIPQTYRTLRLIGQTRCTGATANTRMVAQFNGDATAANYEAEHLAGLAATTLAEALTTLTGAYVGDILLSTAAAGRATALEVVIPNYAAATFQKQAMSRAGSSDGTATNGRAMHQALANWANTAAITSIVLALSTADSFATGSVFTLYGEP